MTEFVFMGWVTYDGVTVAVMKPVNPDKPPDFKAGDTVEVKKVN